MVPIVCCLCKSAEDVTSVSVLDKTMVLCPKCASLFALVGQPELAVRLGPRWDIRLKKAAIEIGGSAVLFVFAWLFFQLKWWLVPKGMGDTVGTVLLAYGISALSIVCGCFGIFVLIEAVCIVAGGKGWNSGLTVSRRCSQCSTPFTFWSAPGYKEVIRCPKCGCLIHGTGR